MRRPRAIKKRPGDASAADPSGLSWSDFAADADGFPAPIASAFKVQGRAEALSDMADMFARLADSSASWRALKAWLEQEIAEVKVEQELLETELENWA